MQKVLQKSAVVFISLLTVLAMCLSFANISFADTADPQTADSADAVSSNEDVANAFGSIFSEQTSTSATQTQTTVEDKPAVTVEVTGDPVDITDTAGNAFVFGDTVKDGITTNTDRDVYSFGGKLAITNANIGGDIISAGETVNVENATAAGSVRIAGDNVTLKAVEAQGNATLAGYIVVIGDGSEFGGVYVAGRDVTVSGTCEALAVVCDTIRINGTVNGDAKVTANKVTIGEDAVVTGTLEVNAPVLPEIPATAKIHEMRFNQTEGTSNDVSVTTTFSPSVIFPLPENLSLTASRYRLRSAVCIAFSSRSSYRSSCAALSRIPHVWHVSAQVRSS